MAKTPLGSILSLPSRGAWIEILDFRISGEQGPRRSPHGERGLKSSQDMATKEDQSRSPHGERGLKSGRLRALLCPAGSLPSRGAWIEMGLSQQVAALSMVAPLTGSVGGNRLN